MPVSFAIDRDRTLVLSRAWGVLTDRQLIGAARALAADPGFQPHFRQLADLHAVTSVQVSGAGIRSMARVVPFGRGSRRAIVVSSDAAYGLARMFETLRSDLADEVEVFRSLEAALAWLKLTDAKDDLLVALAQAPPIPGLE